MVVIFFLLQIYREVVVISRILIVDDNPDIIEILMLMLKKEEYDVEKALNGKEALKKLKTSYYDIAIFDIKLPDMEGIELLEKAQRIQPKTRKIILTGHDDSKYAIDSLNIGAHGYLLKPIKREELLNIISKNLKKLDSEEQLDEEKVAYFLEKKLLNLTR